MTDSLSGVLPVIATPFDDQWEIDPVQLDAEIDWLFANGADGIVVAMVSEILRLSTAERMALNALAVRFARGRGPVVVSVGAESTRTARELCLHARDAGADAVMVTPPLLSPVSEPQLVAYLEEVVDAAGMPVILQDASGYVGASIPVEVQAALVQRFGHERLLLKPETEPLGQRASALLAATSDRARILDGSGGMALLDTFARGIVGTMPGPDLIWAVSALWAALQAGDDDRALAISNPLTAIISMVPGLDGYVAFEKRSLVAQGVFTDARMRGPVTYAIDPPTARFLDTQVELLRRAVA
ncbi:dihydrodipicolinate synthase family protein [Microbacterium paraoxydans]|uniref:Dihydrodipicolinate synthase family protein n=1 Tax=Microbacterium paraoxydans TaxID=199592 RepID=A0ABS5IMB6_9MICO|nr:dihydrodipicolinate synthase family protein [Microbacterium paraoxydans]MBS0024084.1 dihydrodipicolinate synthase family protein [Microbacterium paraoxydans]